MTDATETPSAGWRLKVAAFALAVAIFTVLWFLVAALGTKWGWWPWQVGLGQMTIGFGRNIAFLAVGVALFAQVIAIMRAPRVQPFILALAATLISAMALFRLAGFGQTAMALPPIHDIQTDWNEPVHFSDTLLAERKADGETNPVIEAPIIPEAADARWPGMGGRLVSEVQEEAETQSNGDGTVYPPIRPFYFDQSPVEIAQLAERIARRKGWDLVSETVSEDTGNDIQIEATATSAMFGFKDDVAIRIRPVEGATRVDMRSVSRVGLSDLGANSKRVSGFMNELQDRGDGRLDP